MSGAYLHLRQQVFLQLRFGFARIPVRECVFGDPDLFRVAVVPECGHSVEKFAAAELRGRRARQEERKPDEVPP